MLLPTLVQITSVSFILEWFVLSHCSISIVKKQNIDCNAACSNYFRHSQNTIHFFYANIKTKIAILISQPLCTRSAEKPKAL